MANCWKDRIAQSVKDRVNIDLVAKAFESKIRTYQTKGRPATAKQKALRPMHPNVAANTARQDMAVLLKEKGVANAEATHFLHVCEVLQYSGCGCCEHRKPQQMKGNYHYER